MEKETSECNECGKQDETVVTRKCVYAEEFDKEIYETICDTCEKEHLEDT